MKYCMHAKGSQATSKEQLRHSCLSPVSATSQEMRENCAMYQERVLGTHIHRKLLSVEHATR